MALCIWLFFGIWGNVLGENQCMMNPCSLNMNQRCSEKCQGDGEKGQERGVVSGRCMRVGRLVLPLTMDKSEVRDLGANMPSYTCKDTGLHSSKVKFRKRVLESKPCTLK